MSLVDDQKYLAAVAGVGGPPLTIGFHVHGSTFDAVSKAAIGWSVWLDTRGFLLDFTAPHFSSRFGIMQHATDSAQFVSTGD